MAQRNGTAGDDKLRGTGNADTITASSGSDSARGRGGNDLIAGGEGGDRLFGGGGNDRLYGFDRGDSGSGEIGATRLQDSDEAFRPDSAVAIMQAPGTDTRYLVVEKSGNILFLDAETGEFNETPFLSIPDSEMRASGFEEGLLGLAFHPGYATNGRFFVYVTNTDGDNELRSYTRGDNGRADPDSGDVVLTVPHPDYSNHNGGWIGFGPDGYLYVSTGDGGSGNDPNNNAQNLNNLSGKMLRIDVDGDDFTGDARDYAIPADNPFADGPGADEIWAYGLRNAWRNAFDPETGDLYIADVGQGEAEEVNFQPATSDGGENYGWVIKEGFEGSGQIRPGNVDANDRSLVDPVLAYGHDSDGGLSITGGVVYRGPADALQGAYFYADFVSNKIWSLRVVDGAVVDAQERTDQFVLTNGGTLDSIASFGTGRDGTMFIVGLDGEIFRVTPTAGAGDGADLLKGGGGRDKLFGGADADRLFGGRGADRIDGQGGDDRIVGGAGRDVMKGGAGNDDFVFAKTGDTGGRPDVIRDFGGGDRIDLGGLGSDLTYIGANGFDGTGQVRISKSGNGILVEVNTSGNGRAEMEIFLRNTAVADIDAGDFIL